MIKIKRMLPFFNELMEWALRSFTTKVQPKLLKPSSINQLSWFSNFIVNG